MLNRWLSGMQLLIVVALMLIAGTVYAQSDLDRRVAEIERMDAGSRLARMEARLDSLETIGKGVVTILAGQLLLSGLGIAQRRNERR